MPMMRRAVCLFLMALAGSAPPARAQTPAVAAGRVKVAHGTATLERAGQVRPAQAGLEVFEGDVLRTGVDGRLSVMLKDESRLALGASSALTLTRFAYAPNDQQLGLAVRLTRGVLSYVSGLVAKLAPESVQLQTPSAIIGVRGTHVLVKADAP